MKKKVKDYVEDLTCQYYERKKTFENAKQDFEEFTYSFKQQMNKYYDSAMNEDGKVEINTEWQESSVYENIKSLIMTRIQPVVVNWDTKKLAKVIGKKNARSIIGKQYKVTDWKGLLELLRDSGVSFKEFKKYVEITEVVHTEQLEQLVNLGVVDEEEVKECSEVTVKSTYYKFTEK